MRTYPLLFDRFASSRVDDEARQQTAQVEPRGGPVVERAEVVFGVLVVVHGVVRAGKHRIQVVVHGVDPLELRQTLRHESADHSGQVQSSGTGHCRKAAEGTSGDYGTGREAGPRALAQRSRTEFTKHAQRQAQEVSCLVDRDGGHERNLMRAVADNIVFARIAARIAKPVRRVEYSASTHCASTTDLRKNSGIDSRGCHRPLLHR